MLNKNLILVVLSVFAAGCGIEARTYVITKPRIGYDQIGNGGCVVGTCPPAPAPAETTRKIYVLELTKPVPESEVQKIEEKAANAIVDSTPSPSNTPVSPAAPEAGMVDNQSASASTETTTPAAEETTYTVLKDDTLQKISKKFYGTYRKWYKIYKANKAKIKNPNHVRPGTVLTIPAIK